MLDDLFSGTTAFDEFSTLVMAVNYFLMNNREKNVHIQKMDFEISGREVVKKAELENVLIDKNAYLPDEPMQIDMKLKNEKGDGFSEQHHHQGPQPEAGIGVLPDGRRCRRSDRVRYQGHQDRPTFPSDLSALIRAINNIRKNNRIYLKTLRAVPGGLHQGLRVSPTCPAA